jgi:hypothetical protein
VLVDGEDRTVVHNRHTHGVYFKRELTKWLPGIHPIQLCIPREKVAAAGTITLEKKSPVAFMDPRDPLTYIYETEDKYYKGYQTSLFGITTKKAGWDSLRHYEIMANACIPWFLDIEQCPAPTMAFFPKYEMYRIKELIERKGPEYFVGGPGRQLWELTQTTLQARLLSSCTTEAVARYVLDVASQGMGTGLKPGYLRRLTMAGIFGAASAASMLRRMIRSR